MRSRDGEKLVETLLDNLMVFAITAASVGHVIIGLD